MSGQAGGRKGPEGGATYRFLLDTVRDAGENLLNHVSVVSVRLVVAEAHHTPPLKLRIPMDFYHTVI